MAQSPSPETKFEAMFEAHHRAIQNYCFRRLDPADANDATAEVFLVAWRRIDKAPDGSDELPWLYGVARNVVANSRRSTRRSNRLSARLQSLGDASELGPEPQVVRRHEEERVIAALSKLRVEDQEIIRLRTWEELPNEQIAQILDLTMRAVESRLNRARRKLAKLLSTPVVTNPTMRPLPVERGGER